jgi:hypothetical protein
MHDGRFATLEEMIEHDDHGIQISATHDPNLAKHLSHGWLGLSHEEKRTLVAVPEGAERRASGPRLAVDLVRVGPVEAGPCGVEA